MTGQFLRTLTATGLVDEDWGKEAIDEIENVANKGHEGDTPEQPPFAKNKLFWKLAVNALVMGLLLGLASVVFINIIDEVPKIWSDVDTRGGYDFEEEENVGFNDGKWYWVYVTTGAGFLVGSLRVMMKYPDDLPGFFKEVTDCHVDPTWALPTVLLSAISLGGGANLGPEQAMGNLGGGLANILAERMQLENKEDQKLCVLSGMSGAMGALFPTPVLGVLIIHELGNPPKSYMESTLLMSIPAIASFLVLYTLSEYTWIEDLNANHTLSMHWKFEKWQCGAAVLMGMVAAGISLISLLGVGIMKQLLLRIKMRVDNTKLSGTIFICTLGGFLIGLTNYALPLTIGNGHLVSSAIVKGTTSLNPRLLRCSIFGRAFTMAVSMNCGFVGGFVMPMISMGLVTGVLCHKQYDDIPLGMAVSCFLAAVPSAVCPIPYTMMGVSCFVFFLGLQQTVPVFISCVVAYMCLTGIGVLGALQERANKNNAPVESSFDDEKSLLVGSVDDTDISDSVTMYSKKDPKFSAVSSP